MSELNGGQGNAVWKHILSLPGTDLTFQLDRSSGLMAISCEPQRGYSKPAYLIQKNLADVPSLGVRLRVVMNEPFTPEQAAHDFEAWLTQDIRRITPKRWGELNELRTEAGLPVKKYPI